MKVLKLSRLWFKKAFIGSIHVSFDPKEAMLESVCSDFAINVKARRARGLTSSEILRSVLVSQDRHKNEDCIPFSSPNSFGLSIAGQKKRRKRNPDTLL